MIRRSFDPPRALESGEVAVLRFLLSQPFTGHEELERQLPSVRVAEEVCDGEILDLVVGPDVDPAPWTERVPSSAWGRDADGEAIEVSVHVLDGYIAELEFVRYAPGPVLAFPSAESLKLSPNES